MTRVPQLCDKEFQCISEPQLQLNKTTTLPEISSWEWTHSHSPTPNRSCSNLRFPHTSFLCTNIAKSHKLLSWRSTQEWNMAMSNVFLKTGRNLKTALKRSLKMNSKKGAALRMHLGIIYWRNDTVLEKLTQSNMYIRNQLQWGGEATSCLGFTQNHLSEESGHFLHPLHIRAKAFTSKKFQYTMQVCGTSKYFTHPGWRLKKSRNLRRFIFTIWKKNCFDFVFWSGVFPLNLIWIKKKKKNENTKTWLDSPEN